MTGFTRRGMVGGLALAGLAGCIGLGDGESGAVFEAVRVEGTKLVVELAESADSVTVVSPDGSEFASRSVGAGVSKVSVGLGVRYTPGEHTVVASREGEAVGETTIDIRPDVAIVAVGVGANHPEEMPDGLGNLAEDEALVRIRNRGNGPQRIEKLLLIGDIPNPTTELETVDDDNHHVSGIFKESNGYGSYDSLLIGGNQEKTVYTNTFPFSYQGDGIECTDSRKTGQFEVIPVGRMGNASGNTFRVQYSPAQGDSKCDIRVVEDQ